MNNPARDPKDRDWLARIPKTLAACAARFDLVIHPPMTESYAVMSFNYITPATRSDGVEVVMKLCYDHGSFLTERDGLRLCSPDGSVALIDDDEDLGALLLERAMPGVPLSEQSDDEENTRIAAGVMRRFWRPAPREHQLRTVEDWTIDGMKRHRNRHDGGTGPLPEDLFEQAERMFEELIETTPKRFVLHGDMHHDNILSAEREPWLSIDPKGMEGDPGYDMGSYMGNYLVSRSDSEAFAHQLSRRVDIFADELEMPRDRVVAWCWSHAVLVATWSEEAGDDWRSSIERARIIQGLQ
jgi:streptomycin 6-kinase